MTCATATAGLVPANGGETYTDVRGEGPPLVLLHGGLLTNELSWATQVPRLSSTHRVIAVELRGHGRSPDSDRPYTLDELADDVAGVLDHLGVERADVFGFSLGGMVAVQLAVRHPERVGRLVLASVPVRPEGYVSLEEHPELRPTADDAAAMRRAYAEVAPDPDHFEVVAAKAEALVGSFTGWTDAELAAITAPVLYVVGDSDFVSLEHAVAAVRLFPDAQLSVLPGTTHMGVTRDPAVVLPGVERFLAR